MGLLLLALRIGVHESGMFAGLQHAAVSAAAISSSCSPTSVACAATSP
nr:hypothetical protein [Nannocystis sp.]